MFAVRFVREPDWQKALTRREPDTPTPAFVLADFLPPRGHSGKLSFYWLDDEDEAVLLASAFWLTQKDRFWLVRLTADQFRDLNLETEENEGGTFHEKVNAVHFDVKVSTIAEANRLADAYFQMGELLPMEDSQIKRQIANDNSDSLIDFPQLAGSSNQNAKSKLCSLIKDQTLKICSE